MLEHLFSSPLYSAKLEKHQENKNKLVPLLYEDISEVQDKNKHDSWWSCNSYQTFLRGYGQEELEGQMFEHVDNYMNALGYTAVTYKIDSWFNMYGPNQYQEQHYHLPNLLSGLYVIRFDKGLHTNLVFKNRFPELAVIHHMAGMEPTNYSDAHYTNEVNLEEGKVYIFPSNLQHLVPPQPAKLDKDNYRITFTFNITL